jgi:hypothetical protein
MRRVCFAGKSNERDYLTLYELAIIYLKVCVIVVGGCFLVIWQYNTFVYKLFESIQPLFLAYSQIFVDISNTHFVK